MCPKKDGTAWRPPSFLGTTLCTWAHWLSQTLPIRYSWSQNQIDRKFFRQGIATRLIFFHPPLFSHRFKRRGEFPLERPQIERGFVDGDLPIVSSVLYKWSDGLIERPHPPFPENRARYRPGNLINLETDKFVMRFAADKT